MRDHFEPIYAHRFYVGSILCAYIVSESMLGRFCVHICCQNQFLTILNLYVGVHRNGTTWACAGTRSKNFPGRPTPQPQPLQLETHRHTRTVDH